MVAAAAAAAAAWWLYVHIHTNTMALRMGMELRCPRRAYVRFPLLVDSSFFFPVILTLHAVGCKRKVTALSARCIVIDCLKLCANSRLSSYQYFVFPEVPPTFAVGQSTKRCLISFSWATLSNLHWLKLI
jgi:hypothetical protein